MSDWEHFKDSLLTGFVLLIIFGNIQAFCVGYADQRRFWVGDKFELKMTPIKWMFPACIPGYYLGAYMVGNNRQKLVADII